MGRLMIRNAKLSARTVMMAPQEKDIRDGVIHACFDRTEARNDGEAPAKILIFLILHGIAENISSGFPGAGRGMAMASETPLFFGNSLGAGDL